MHRAALAGVLALACALTAGIPGCGGRREEPPPPPPPPPAPPPCPIAAAAPVTGQATSYAAGGTGSCSFDPSADRRVAAIGAADYAKAAWCGACVEVAGPRGRAVVQIVDRCPACKPGDLDLSREAFAAIAPLEAGRVAISWRPVPCEVTGPLAYRFKEGSSAFWAAIQVRNHRYPIATLEARDPAGAWKPVPRADYNYFVATGGLGAGPLALRVTDVRGRSLEDAAIPIGDGVVRAGAAQLSRCPGD